MSAYRMLFISIAGVILLGIWLTGFDRAHWFLYLPVVMLAFAGVTGFCPGLILWRKLGFSDTPMSFDLPGKKRS